MHEGFASVWESRWQQPDLLATPDELKHRFPDLWVRFHCLPESKRYAEDESEYAVILGRYNTVLDDVFGDTDVYIVSIEYDSESERSQAWRTVVTDEDPEFGSTYAHLSLRRVRWRSGMLDEELRRVADFQDAGGVVTDSDARWLFHPYDGGMDVLAPTIADRDSLRDRHRDWLSAHPLGL
jgi:hypothetical protein